MSQVVGSMLLVVAALVTAAPARAQILTFEFAGVVATLTRDGGLFGAPGTVQLGDPFTGRFSYDASPSNPDQLPEDPEVGRYDVLTLTIDQAVIPLTSLTAVSIVHEPGLATLPPAPPDLGRDRFAVSATSEPYPLVTVQLRGPFDSAFSDDSLPIALDLADFPVGAFVQGLTAAGLFPNPSIEDVGSITSLQLVPEAGASARTGGALAALVVLARRRRVALPRFARRR
jgi:hypothetical protein